MPNPEGVVANTPTLLCQGITGNTATTVEIVPTGERCVITAIFFKSTIAADNISVQNQAGTVLYAIELGASGHVFTPLPHPILSTDGLQVVVTGTSPRWSVAYKVI